MIISYTKNLLSHWSYIHHVYTEYLIEYISNLVIEDAKRQCKYYAKLSCEYYSFSYLLSFFAVCLDHPFYMRS